MGIFFSFDGVALNSKKSSKYNFIKSRRVFRLCTLQTVYHLCLGHLDCVCFVRLQYPIDTRCGRTKSISFNHNLACSFSKLNALECDQFGSKSSLDRFMRAMRMRNETEEKHTKIKNKIRNNESFPTE